jgi:hypothetical protein
MHRMHRYLDSFVLGVALIAPVGIQACNNCRDDIRQDDDLPSLEMFPPPDREDTNRLAQFLSEYCGESSISPAGVANDDVNPDVAALRLCKSN